MSYYTFLRSARNFEEFSRAKKITQETGLTYDEARESCANFNDHRTDAEIEAGTKMEFTLED